MLATISPTEGEETDVNIEVLDTEEVHVHEHAGAL